MRVLLVHEYYRERGGEDVAFETDARLLADAGHEVSTLIFHNDEIADRLSLRDRAGLFATTVWSRSAAKRVTHAIREHRPDVVHFHNTFPLVSPSGLKAAHDAGVPVVATLHNYRLLCANAELFREGRVCEDCVGARVPLAGVRHACYRGSKAQSAAVASMLVFNRLRGSWWRYVDCFLAPSTFLRDKLVQGGLPAAKIVVRSNAVEAPVYAGSDDKRSGFLFVGRLAANKGIESLIDAWLNHPELPRLRLAGTGDLESDVRRAADRASGRIEYLGALPREQVFEAMRSAEALVFPSIWYETQGLTILEAFASGTPVIASLIGAVPEAVIEGETGLLFAPGDAGELATKVRWAAENLLAMRGMGKKAFEAFRERYAPHQSIAELVSVYERLAGPVASYTPARSVG